MSVYADLHHPKQVIAAKVNDSSWLKMTDKDGNAITVFMPFETALAMAGVFNRMTAAPDVLKALTRAEQFMSGFEGDESQPGIDEALIEVRAAIARTTEASA